MWLNRPFPDKTVDGFLFRGLFKYLSKLKLLEFSNPGHLEVAINYQWRDFLATGFMSSKFYCEDTNHFTITSSLIFNVREKFKKLRTIEKLKWKLVFRKELLRLWGRRKMEETNLFNCSTDDIINGSGTEYGTLIVKQVKHIPTAVRSDYLSHNLLLVAKSETNKFQFSPSPLSGENQKS